jgi:hypothetical protein
MIVSFFLIGKIIFLSNNKICIDVLSLIQLRLIFFNLSNGNQEKEIIQTNSFLFYISPFSYCKQLSHTNLILPCDTKMMTKKKL